MRRLAPLVLLCALLASCTGRGGTNTDAGVDRKLNGVDVPASGVFKASDRDLAPSLSGSTLDGQEVEVSALRGKVVVLNFWASWCAPCRAEARNLNAVYDKTRALGVTFLGVDIKDDRTAAQAFVRSKHVPYPSLFDQSGLLLLKFRGQAPQSPPTTLVLDREGRVAARFVQPVTENELLVPVQAIARETG